MSEQRHVCILTTAHPLDDVRVNSKIASSFLARGFKVSWVGPDVSFFKGASDRDPRVEYFLTKPNRTRLDRVLSARRVERKAREVADVDWYYSPDPDSAGVSVKMARRTGAKFLFDIHEVYHGALLDRWTRGFRLAALRELVRRRIAATCRSSDLVIGVSDSVLRPYVALGRRAMVVRNCAPRWFADRAVERDPQRPSLPLVFMHGKGGADRGTPVVLDALASLAADPGVARVVIFADSAVGTPLHAPTLLREIGSRGLTEAVWLHESVTHEEMPSVLAQCDVGIIAYGRGLGEDSLPNRIFEYMASGLAVLTPSYAVEIKRIVDGERCGLTVDFEDAEAVAAAMRELAADPEETRKMGERARDAFLARHNWDAEFDMLLERMNALES